MYQCFNGTISIYNVKHAQWSVAKVVRKGSHGEDHKLYLYMQTTSGKLSWWIGRTWSSIGIRRKLLKDFQSLFSFPGSPAIYTHQGTVFNYSMFCKWSPQIVNNRDIYDCLAHNKGRYRQFVYWLWQYSKTIRFKIRAKLCVLDNL